MRTFGYKVATKDNHRQIDNKRNEHEPCTMHQLRITLL
jgi:hypothetical protein